MPAEATQNLLDLGMELDELGLARVDFKTYRGMAHSACQEELQHLAAFIAGALSDA